MSVNRVVSALQGFAADGRRAVLLIAALALLLRVAVALWLGDTNVWSDGTRYLKVAGNLLDGRGFGGIIDNRLSVPALALLIAGVQAVFGPSLLPVRLVCALLGTASCVMGYYLTRRLFGLTAALLAGLLLAVYPLHVYLSAVYEYPQTLCIAEMAGFFLLLLRFQETNRIGNLFAAGLVLGIAILTVPTLLLFVPLLVLFLGLGSLRRLLVAGLVLGAALLVTVGPWTLRNYLAYGQVILVNKAMGQNLWLANNPTYYQYGKDAVVIPCTETYGETVYCRAFLDDGVRIGNAGLSDLANVTAYEAAGMQRATGYISEHPGQFAELAVAKFLRFWSPVPDAVSAAAGSARDWIAIASYVPILLLGLAGLLRTRGRWRELAPIYLYFIALTAPYCVFLPTTRYRLPLDYFLIIFAALAADQWLRARATTTATARTGT